MVDWICHSCDVLVVMTRGGSSDFELLFGGKASSAKKRKAAWEDCTEVDRNLELSHGSGKSAKVITGLVLLRVKLKQAYGLIVIIFYGFAVYSQEGHERATGPRWPRSS